MNAGPGRTVVQEDRFRRELAAIEPDVRRTDEALFYVEHLVAREPWVGLPTRQPEVWIAPILLPSGAHRSSRIESKSDVLIVERVEDAGLDDLRRSLGTSPRWCPNPPESSRIGRDPALVAERPDCPVLQSKRP